MTAVKRFGRTILLGTLGFALLTVPALGNAQWLKKGADLLRGLGGSNLSAGELSGGLQDALRVGSDRVVTRLSAPGGFENDKAVHIPLPGSLDTVRKALSAVGMSGMLDDLEHRLNLAAEHATPKAKALFVDAISQMTFEDARAIVDGPNDAATRYFQGKMTPPLKVEMAPVVQASLAEVGALKSYDQVMARYEALPFVPDAKANLSDYVVEKGMDGIFHYLASEEAAIRSDPAKRTTDLLKKVFSR